jgi:predicted NUDIX family NTP pyrophosphohydrolase
MGGPLWARRDARAWSIPKGEPLPGEPLVDTARREFAEELGRPVPTGALVELGEVRQSGGKVVTAFAVRGDFDPADLNSGTFELEWPPRSGRRQEFPELDRVAWFELDDARDRIVAAQAAFLDRLDRLAAEPDGT